jgi:cobalt/nickel transport system permease protein
LPFGVFILFMQPIHLAIGIVEGIITAAVLCYIYSFRPELLNSAMENKKNPVSIPVKKILITFAVLTVITGGILSVFASSYPDGLEWSIEGVSGKSEIEREGEAHNAAASIVNSTAFMPDYSFKGDEDGSVAGTATAGIIGSVITAFVAIFIGFVIHKTKKRKTVSV